MSIRVVCPHCEAAFNVADDLRGKKVRCRECEKPVPVVAAKPRRADDDEDEREEHVQARPSKPAPAPVRRGRADEDDERPARNIRKRDDDDEDDDRPAPRKGKKKSSSTGLIVAAVGGGVVLLAGIIGVVVWLAMRDSDKKAENTPVTPPAGFPSGANPGKGGPGPGVMGNGPPGGMMMGGGAGGMQGKGGAPDPAGLAEARRIENAIAIAKQLDPEVRKKIEASTVFIGVKDKEKNPTFAASGSGFLAFEPGIVLTNAHVVDMLEPGSVEPESITVSIHSGLPDQKDLKAKVLAVDQKADLAVLRIDPAGLPPPLIVKSSTGLVSTQLVYICGFPRGKIVSNSVTILPGQVASLSHDPKTGVLDKVVMTSDMQPGNSGGPVVNDTGEVVGVNVDALRGTRINRAVPGDYVHVIINGRITRMRTGQSSFSAGQVKVPVVAELINPMGRLSRVEVDVWMGDDAADYYPPASNNNAPAPRPGDSPHMRYDLELNGDKATGEFMLPDPAPGKSYYWQPVVTYKEKDKPQLVHWSIGEKYTPDQPVYRRPAKLLHKKLAGNRNVSVGIKQKFSLLLGKAEESLITVKFDGELTEQPGTPDEKGKSVMRINVHTMKPDVKLPDDLKKEVKEIETMEKERQRVFNSVGHLDLRMLINERGDIEKGIASAKSAPSEIRAEVESIGEDILDWLQAASIPLSNRQMNHGEPWTHKRPFAVLTPFLDLHFKEIEMTYTYLGVRTRNNREEALVDLSGKLRNKHSGPRFGCRLDGRALVDLETGLVTMARTTTTMDLDLSFGPGGGIPARGTMEVNFERSLPGAGN
jgi:predicted Zn finger-like uncharacterized protein